MTTEENLTIFETRALEVPYNLSDGHARQRPTAGQAKIFDELGELFELTATAPFFELETSAHREFFSALGQTAAPIGSGRILSCYSSSVAMDIFARALTARTDAVAVIHPTFDNIPDLLKAWGHRLVPVSQEAIAAHDARAVFRLPVGCLFVTVPNNPTGWTMPAATLSWLAEECAARNVLLGLDTSFRGFDSRMWYDMYTVIEASGVDYVVIEDSGKLWPSQDLKAGFLVLGTSSIPVVDAFSDVLLTVSPVLLALVRALAQDAAGGGWQLLHRSVADTRALVRDRLAELGFPAPADPDSRVSVERVRLPAGLDAAEVYQQLSEIGVHILPCGPFHWADPEEGDNYIRISLARDPELVQQALSRMTPRLSVLLDRVLDRSR